MIEVSYISVSWMHIAGNKMRTMCLLLIPMLTCLSSLNGFIFWLFHMVYCVDDDNIQ